ncbi:Gfo/Idh/MocA family oxidoreductase [Streptomyces sp. B21-105]|uniref:Gfo/Idh/MocA family protein n=1 Tax=Streptomyces sp. B21-105 TaxID=3039417 RepID=UPI002FF313E6
MTNDRAVVLVGCGYAADFYVACLTSYPHLKLVGAYDIDQERATTFCGFHGITRFGSLTEALDQDAIVANLTTIESHHEVTKAALLRGRHVFSEKPLALAQAETDELRHLAETRGLLLASAPSTSLGPCYGAVREALHGGLIGRPLVVHANLEDGAVHRMDYRNWISPSGQPWPARHEFAAGPILEHAGYQLTWLVRLFGGVKQMTGMTTTVEPAPRPKEATDWRFGPNLALWSLTHDSGVVTRLSAGGVAPRDYSMRIFGEEGVLEVEDVMRLNSPVAYRRSASVTEHSRIGYLGPTERLRYDTPPPPYDDTHYIDFAAGLAEMADCLDGPGAPRLGLPLSAHVLELTLELITSGARTVRPTTRYGEPRETRTPR